MNRINNSMINLERVFSGFRNDQLELIVTQNYKDDRPCLWECGTNLGNRISIIGVLDNKGHRKRPVLYMYGAGRELGHRSALHHISPGHKVVTAVMTKEGDETPLVFGIWEIEELQGKEISGNIHEIAILKKVAEQEYNSFQDYILFLKSSNMDYQGIHTIVEPEMLGQIGLIFREKVRGHRSIVPYLSRRWKIVPNSKINGEIEVSPNTTDSLYKIYSDIEHASTKFLSSEKFLRAKKEDKFALLPKMFVRYQTEENDGVTSLTMQIAPIIGGEPQVGNSVVFPDISKVKNFCTPVHDAWSERDLEFLVDEVKEAGGILDRFYQFLG